MQPVTEADFGRMLAAYERSAFRFETRDFYAIDIEQAAYDAFLSGHPLPPAQVDWWQDWIGQISRQTREGKAIGRVRVLAEPPTDYQQFEMWCGREQAKAGETILYLTRSQAQGLGLPLGDDWWLLDERELVVMHFTDAGEIAGKELHTDPHTIATYLTWRDLAVRNATPAEHVTAV